jgi:hypothetical protein
VWSGAALPNQVTHLLDFLEYPWADEGCPASHDGVHATRPLHSSEAARHVIVRHHIAVANDGQVRSGRGRCVDQAPVCRLAIPEARCRVRVGVRACT